MPSSLTWKYAYVTDKDTLIIMHYLLYHQSFEKGTLSLLWAQFRSAITNNNLGINEGRLAFYETSITTARKICRIEVPVSFHHKIFSLLHASHNVGHMEGV